MIGLAYMFYINGLLSNQPTYNSKVDKALILRELKIYITNRLKLKVVNMKLLHCQVHLDCHLFELLLMELSSLARFISLPMCLIFQEIKIHIYKRHDQRSILLIPPIQMVFRSHADNGPTLNAWLLSGCTDPLSAPLDPHKHHSLFLLCNISDSLIRSKIPVLVMF